MNHYKLVATEHLNHHGSLHGGILLKWVDEYGYITAMQDYPGNCFVTIGLEDTEFKHRIELGAVIKISFEQLRLGNSSLTYSVKVTSADVSAELNLILFETEITYVNVDERGNKALIFR